MRILVLSHEFPPIGGGGGHVAKDLCQGLSELGHEIKILTAGILGGIDDETGSTKKAYEIIRLPTLRKDPSRANMVAMVSYIIISIFRGFFLCMNWRPDVIHVHFAVPAGPISWVLSKLTGIPYVLTVHLGDIPGGTPDKTDKWFRFIQPFTYPIWKHAEQVIAVSQFSRSLAQKHYPVPIKVIHNGVDIRKFKPEQNIVHDPTQIIFAGRFVPQKNPILVIRILADLADYSWELTMLGDGPLYKETIQEIKKHGLEDRIKTPGWVNPEVVKKEFEKSDILFLPSKSEGLPVVGVQALASGLAFMVSDIGGFGDIVEQGKNGFRVPLEEPDCKDLFVHGLSEMIGNKEKLLFFKESSNRMAEKFDINEITKQYDLILNQSAQKNRKNAKQDS
ncbi:MAG: glycosyltransferase family 4 protein [Anaerolineales bacterium]|nr:glycosyltransferase family 4 protein [Anaerolineales bacterium]